VTAPRRLHLWPQIGASAERALGVAVSADSVAFGYFRPQRCENRSELGDGGVQPRRWLTPEGITDVEHLAAAWAVVELHNVDRVLAPAIGTGTILGVVESFDQFPEGLLAWRHGGHATRHRAKQRKP
jgi:hypothetical protein